MAEPRKRRARDPEATREIILEAARTLLAKHGPEAISLSEVAHLAGVNRGTAYQHFQTREKLIEATADWVADKLFRAVFGDPETLEERRVEEVDNAELTDRMADFGRQNPELCRIWLLQLLSSPNPENDPFWREYHGSLARFTRTDLAEPGIDSEVLSITMLAGAFLWPIWARSHARDEGERETLAKRYAYETLRLSMYGTLREERFPAIAERLDKTQRTVAKLRAKTGKD
ncbi:MAG TPA: TetR/AcrR family transcriptional regulator [Sphingobium sp.]